MGLIKARLLLIIVLGIVTTSASAATFPQMRTGTASWYSIKSCLREGTSGIMANGKRLDDGLFTAASWDYPFDSVLRITNRRSGISVDVQVTDRGPAKRLYKKGRIADLSKAAFAAIADLHEGVIPVTVERIQ